MEDDFCLIDCSLKDDKFFKTTFREACIGYYNRLYPNEYIPLSSISVGTVFRSKNVVSCQVRFLNNGYLFLCRYLIDERQVQLEVYNLSEVVNAGVFEGEDGKQSIGMYANKNTIDQIIIERKEKNIGKEQTYKVKRCKRTN